MDFINNRCYLGGETGSYGDFNFIVFLITLFSGGLSGLLVYAIGEHLNNQEIIIDKLSKLVYSQEKTDELINNSEVKTHNGEWRCPKCGKTNSTSLRVCKDCGYNR